MDTALHIAAENSNYRACEILLEWGVDINAANVAGRTPLMVAGNAKIAKLLCEKGAGVDVQDMYGMAALRREVCRLASFTKLGVLLQNGVNTEIGENRYDEKPLHTATSYSCERGVKILLESGANVNARDVNGLTPLSRAAMVKSPGVVKLLLEKGASPDFQDRFGGSPFTRARG